MLDHLKKTLAKVLNGNGNELVLDAFSPVSSDDRSLPRDIAQFVANGEPTDVLGRIPKISGFAETVGVLCSGVWSVDGPKYAAHRKLIGSLGSWEAPALVRLAQVYLAASKAPSKHAYGQPTIAAWRNGYEWLELFFRQVTGTSGYSWSSKPKPRPPVTLKTLEAMVVANEQDPAQVTRGALIPDTKGWGWNVYADPFRSFSDFKDALERNPGVVREGFNHPEFKVRIHVLESIGVARANPLIWRDEIAGFMVVSSKQVRQAAEPLVRQCPAEFRALLERHAREGDNETRGIAVQSCHRIFGDEAREFLRERRAEEKAKKVIGILDDILRTPEPEADAASLVDDWALPPLQPVSLDAPLDESLRNDLRACLEKAYAEALAAYERIKHQRWAGKFEASYSEDLVDAVFEELQYGTRRRKRSVRIPGAQSWREGTKRILEFPIHPSFTPLHLVRWCVIWTGQPNERYWFSRCSASFAAYSKIHPRPGLREVAAIFEALGYDANFIGRAYLGQYNSAYSARVALFQQPPEGIWPYFAERLQLFEEALGAVISETTTTGYMARFEDRNGRRNALTALSKFPRTPKRLLPLLWEIALTGAKAERLDAQESLSREPDTVARLIASLASGQMEVRAEAAGWLTRLNAQEAKSALLAALKKEKKEVAQGAMMLALESFGIPIGELIDRKGLEKEAEKQASKDLPADLSWFPFTSMPALRWADDSGVVSPNLVRLLLVQAFKLKNPEPGPLLRNYAGLFAATDRHQLGRFIAEAWMAQDTIPAHTTDEAARLAEAQTKQTAQYFAQYPQYAASWDEQKHYRSVYNGLLAACKGSAISSKGVLAVAGALANGSIAPIVHRYIKQYYGMRGAQAKALLQMLAWIDDPNAIQVLLAIGNRFRTKGIQEEATRLCQQLADRKNWTLDELADRTIPTAGLDEDGILELDFGARSFTARLTADFTLTLTNSDGREIKSLPDSNKADDEEKAKAAKQALSATRKELKTVLKLQEERLYEAMCTQREWIFGDFRTFILSHPIVSRFCERLVWCVVEDGKVTGTFRPLPDKSLTNTDDDAVEVPETARVRLAHEATLTSEQRDSWKAHLADYKVEPLFQQFGKPVYVIPADRRDEAEIDEYRGHVVDNFKLRGRLTKLGYTRGQAQDGGWFMDYNKRFPGLGIQATINFSGSPLPEENKPVALISLCFSPIGEGEASIGDSGMRLSDLPAVLVSECWNDFRQAAADGKGFDPNWEKAVQY